jgi:hypothetical protein
LRSNARQQLLSRQPLHGLALVAILLAGCRNGSRPSPAPGGAVGADVGSPPGHFSDLAPGDTAGVIAMMRQVMRGIDAGLGPMTQRDTAFGGGTDSISHHLTAWLQDGVPRKLVVIDSVARGQSNVETDVWFMGGDVTVLLQAADAYAFDSDRIVLWTDEALQPYRDVTPALLMARQSELIGAVHAWLAALGIR